MNARFRKESIVETFEEVHKQFEPMIRGIMRKIGIYKNHDEFYQIGLIALWQAHERYEEGKSAFSTYAYAYILGRIMSELRKNRLQQERFVISPDEGFRHMEDRNGSNSLQEETLRSYCKAARLTKNQTKWVLYYSLQQMKIKEIAEVEHVASCTVKDWRSGAIKKLRSKRERMLQAGELV